MIESIVLGIIQGITEWLPISSEAMVALAQVHLFGANDAGEVIRFAIFLHLGTFFAALIYLRKDVIRLLNFTHSSALTQIELKFLVIATIISGTLGLSILMLIETVEDKLLSSGESFTLLIGFALLATAWLQLRKRDDGMREVQDLIAWDGIILGAAQAISVIPGISRSGTTVAVMLFRKIDGYEALRLSFLMSLPIVLGANIVLNFSEITQLTAQSAVALGAAFVTGLITIHWLLKLARRVNFGWLALIFGTLSIIAVVI